MKIRIDDIQSGDPFWYFDARTVDGAFAQADCIIGESGRDLEYGYEGYLLFEIEQDEKGDIIKRELE